MAPVPILYVHSSAQLYGSDRLLLNMAAGLDCDRFRPVVVLPEDGPLVAALQQAGVAVHRGKLSVLHRTLNPLFWAGFWGHLPLSVANLARLIKAEGVRLVHSNTSHVLDGALAAKAAGVPHVWHIREVHTGLSKLGRPLSRFVYASSERVLCMSTASKEAFFGRRPNDPKLQVVYDGVNPARFELPGNGTALRAGLGLPPQAPLLGMVGRIAHWKGHRLFLQAAAQVRRQFPAARFLIVGDAVTPGDARLKH
ncbi:MAG: glycosyltransferase, partial [Anaerolineae bacterium]